jgi:hypothetical protein
VASIAKRLPHLDTNLPTLPTLQSFTTHHPSYWQLPVHPARFLQVNIDLVGPLQSSAGFKSCLTAVDRFTRWPKSNPIPHITAETLSRSLLSGCISLFCCPQSTTTNQGRQFESRLFHKQAKLCDFRLFRTTPPFHRQWNRGTIAPFDDGSHHVLRGEAMGRRTANSPPRHTHNLQGGSAVFS